MNQLEAAGIVGPFEGNKKARQVKYYNNIDALKPTVRQQ
jgi:hypothetical protein